MIGAAASGALVRRALLLVAVSVAVAALAATPARADGVADEAELQFQLGIDSYRAGDYVGALEHFLSSNRLVPNRNVNYNIAQCYARLGRPADAYRYYVDARIGETDAEQLAAIDAALAELTPQVAVIDVTTEPAGATIYLDRIDLGSVGSAPRTLAVPAGEHVVVAELDGHVTTTSAPFDAIAGSRIAVRMTLWRILGRIEITDAGEARGAEVRLDSEHADVSCRVPCSIAARPGAHDVFVSRAGYARVVLPVVVEEDLTVSTGARLEPLTGALLVSADTEDARVELDGRAIGFTPTVAHDVPIGPHHVRITLEGYQPFETDVEVLDGEETALEGVSLVPVRAVAAASRRSEAVEDAPASVSVVSAAELEAFGYPTIYEALRGLRGVALTHDTTYSNVSIRGVGQPNDYSNRLLVLSDGASLNDDVLYQAFTGFDGRVDLGDVERLELVRGPGSVLYGTGAVSGVVNLVPRTRDIETHARFSIGAAESVVGRLRASFGVRLGTDSGIEASVSGAHSGGRDLTLVFDGDRDGVPERRTAHGADAFSGITTSGRAWHEALSIQWLYAFRELSVPAGTAGSIFDRSDDRYQDQRGLLEVRYEPRLDPHVQLFTRLYANYARFESTLFYEGVAPAEDRFLDAYTSVWVGGEARGVWRPIEPLTLTLGADVNHHPLVEMVIGADGRDAFVDGNHPFTVYAGYVLADWQPIPEVHVQAGLRVDGWDLFNGNDAAMPRVDDFASPSPRLAVILRPTADDTLKIMGGRAFRAPSTYEIFYQDDSTHAPSSRLGPESFTSAEVEYTHRFDADWSVLIAAHGTVAEGFIETAAAPPLPGRVRYGNSLVPQYFLGGDAEVRRELRNGWMLAAQYGYLESRFVRTPDGSASDRVPNAPNHYASFRAVVPFVDRMLVGALRTTLEAPRRIEALTSAESEWAVVADFVLSGTVADIGLRYLLGVYNLFDWQVALPVSPFPASTMPQRGRSFLFSLELTI